MPASCLLKGGHLLSDQWYALRSKPHKEECLQRYVNSQGYNVFFPRLKVKPVNPRSRKVKAYFPGYMFVHACLESAGECAFRYLPFSLGLVWLGGTPAVVPEAVIATLRARLGQIEAQGGLLENALASGEQVMVCGGAFEGYQGLFDAYLSGQDRVRVLLKMLNERYLPVEIAREFIVGEQRAQ